MALAGCRTTLLKKAGNQHPRAYYSLGINTGVIRAASLVVVLTFTRTFVMFSMGPVGYPDSDGYCTYIKLFAKSYTTTCESPVW